jgi:hypothetical protein
MRFFPRAEAESGFRREMHDPSRGCLDGGIWTSDGRTIRWPCWIVRCPQTYNSRLPQVAMDLLNWHLVQPIGHYDVLMQENR